MTVLHCIRDDYGQIHVVGEDEGAILFHVVGGEAEVGDFFKNIARSIKHSAEHLAKGSLSLATFRFKDLARQAKGLVHDAESLTHDLAPILHVGEMILSNVQGLVSLIPGIGTGISAAIGAALAVLHGGGPLEIAIRTAYGAIPIPPGIKSITDMVLEAVLSLLHTKDLGEAAIQAVKVKIPKGLPRDVFDTLIHVVVHALTKKPTHAVATPKPGIAPGTKPRVALVPPKVAPAPAPSSAPSTPRPTSTPASSPAPATSWLPTWGRPSSGMIPAGQFAGRIPGGPIILRF